MHSRAQALLRFSLAFVFLYAAIAGLTNPSAWVGFLPLWLENIASLNSILFVWSIVEIILGLTLVALPRAAWPAGVAFLALFGMIVTNIGAFDILFRDVGLALAALALFIEQRDRF